MELCFTQGDSDYHSFPLEGDYDVDPEDTYVPFLFLNGGGKGWGDHVIWLSEGEERGRRLMSKQVRIVQNLRRENSTYIRKKV